jgi:hypothetical protein
MSREIWYFEFVLRYDEHVEAFLSSACDVDRITIVGPRLCEIVLKPNATLPELKLFRTPGYFTRVFMGLSTCENVSKHGKKKVLPQGSATMVWDADLVNAVIPVRHS